MPAGAALTPHPARRLSAGSRPLGARWVAAFLLAVGIADSVSAAGFAGVLTGRTEWSGEVRVEGDVRIPPGAELVIRPGTRVRFDRALSTKTDPPYWNPDTELAVAGVLDVRGTAERPVVFEGADGRWGGLVAEPGAVLRLAEADIRGADEGVLCAGGSCILDGVRIRGGEYGLVLGPGAQVVASAVAIAGCRVGVYDAREAAGAVAGVAVEDAADAAWLAPPPARVAAATAQTESPTGARVEYVGEYTVAADEEWSGEVILAGRITVIPGAVLTLLPGTRLAFRKVDSDGDGLGEGELLVLGGIRSLGLAGRPVIFESAESRPGAGDWDKVSLISSEDPENRFEHTVFRHGVQALHAHFSSFRAQGCLFEENLRAVQFQESAAAVLQGNVLARNKQALRFRDSRAQVTGNVFLGNLYGVHVFRSDLRFEDNTLEGNLLGGLLAKESRVKFRRNRVLGNRDGARLRGPDTRADIVGNLFSAHAEDGLSLSGVEAAITGNRFEGAGLDLVSSDDASLVLRNNVLLFPGRYTVHLKGSTSVDAVSNFWGVDDVPGSILDQVDDPALGMVNWFPPLKSSPSLDLPRKSW